MEQITLVVTTRYSRSGVPAQLDRLWIGEAETPVKGRTISQCLEQMYMQGWMLTRSRAVANLQGIFCEYDFEREDTPKHQELTKTSVYSKSFSPRQLSDEE